MQDIKPRNNNGIPHGLWKEFHENGQLIFICNYVNGKPIGPARWFYPDGKLKYNLFYYDNLNMRFENYDNNILKQKGSFKNGVVVGYWETFDNSGKSFSKKFYAI